MTDAAVVDAANEAPVADPQQITVVEDVAQAITLTGSDPEGGALSFALVSGPTVGTLTGTPPELTYTPGLLFTGADSFVFSVSDSALQVTSATIDISVVVPVPAIYEPFDYPINVGIGGQSGNSEIGFLTAWTSSGDGEQSQVVAPSLSQGPLSVKGGHLLSPGDFARFIGDRSILPESLSTSGLLDHGSVLWFSAMVGLGASVNQGNAKLDFALATAPFGLGNPDRFIQTVGPTAGAGVGFTLNEGIPRAAVMRSTGIPLVGANSTPQFDENQNGLIVGKITWGATGLDDDTIELFQPSLDLTVLGAPFSTRTTTVDQSKFDTLTMRRNSRPVIDEIRFGRSLSSVLVGP